ncbi:MAG: uracil-DNA glycosylase [Patescibacteria group bacterium]
MIKDEPYTLRDEAERKGRKKLLNEKHMVPLTALVEEIKASVGKGADVPYFDPMDGGIAAKVLFVLEAPGPKAVESGFISRNNPDPSASNFYNMSVEAELPRENTISWNIVPWYIGNGDKIRPAGKSDIEEGKQWFFELLRLLTSLEYIVLVGAKARSIHPWLSSRTDARILSCHHPSNRVKASSPNLMKESRDVMKFISKKLSPKSH